MVYKFYAAVKKINKNVSVYYKSKKRDNKPRQREAKHVKSYKSNNYNQMLQLINKFTVHEVRFTKIKR